MKIIEVPEFNEDGSIKATHLYSPEEAQNLLQFAVNFMLAVGHTAQLQITPGDNPQQEMEFDD